MAKENRELQEELKLREDSIFEQDDELERRNSEIRAQKSSIEQMKRELNLIYLISVAIQHEL
ncbi:unnamed protein product [Trichobilharzia regenti]|nr:unnamed protein product [Trichobilharzia regenti]